MPTSNRRSISYTLPWDDAPLDLSFIFEGEKPAGRRGFLRAKDARLMFEDGSIARFWGTNFNSAANFPPHAYSEKVARRLAKFGVNLVRFHQMDADYSTPNIFQFTKGRRLNDTQSLDPTSLDRLDYLIHCLKQEGIYVYMDLLTYRTFRSGDGVAEAGKIGHSARPYSTFDPRLIELQKKFNKQLWTHINPYTKLAYKDEPAIALTEITNENDVFCCSRGKWIEPYLGQLQARFVEWAGRKGLEVGAGAGDFSDNRPEIVDFLVDTQKSYYAEMIAHLRKIGVRIPITGTNWSRGAALLEAQMATDFTDSHTYWYEFGIWKPEEKRLMNKSLLGERATWLEDLSTFRVLHKPFFVSEWDHPWPNEYRAEGAIQLAAVAAFQGWSGAAIHTYRYDCREHTDQIGAPITSDAIGGVPYRGGVFDTFNDPAKFGLFYHAALMLRRADVREPSEATEIVLPCLTREGTLIRPPHQGMEGAAEFRKVGVRLPGAPARGHHQAPTNPPLVPLEVTEIRSETGELYRNLSKRYATIDTPRTQAAYGFLAEAGEIVLSGLKIKAETDFAVIAISSLTEEPLPRSNNLLLTAVGRADNTGAKYNADHTIQLDVGHGPIQVEVIEADLELTTEMTDLKIWAINPAGFPIGQTPVIHEGGRARFKIGGAFPSIYYLIQQA
ncbi:MAG: hypothetical protein IT578_11705 [Verrucomicrobiae bacterium]|nr:hypothetical protein [Verrucomicrobiae bacterium]